MSWMGKAAAIAAFLVLVYLSVFVADQYEYVVVLQFGETVSVIDEPNLCFKWFWQNLKRYKKSLMIYDPPAIEVLTRDKKNVVVNPFACWKISDPSLFLETVADRQGAESRLSDIMLSEVGSALGKMLLSDFISTDEAGVSTDRIMAEVTRKCNEASSKQFGIEVVDVLLKRLNFPEQNKESVFRRMRAERKRIARKYRSEGEAEAVKIRAETDKSRSVILAEAYRDAEKIKGEGDAEAVRIYGEAYREDPEFYRFIRTLEAYPKILDSQTTLVLPSDARLLEYLYKDKP